MSSTLVGLGDMAAGIPDSNDDRDGQHLFHFTWFGFVLGGLLPVAVPLLLQKMCPPYRLIPQANIDWYTIVCLVFFVCVTPGLLLAQRLQRDRIQWARILRTGCAALSILTVTAVVWLTGGAIDSPFAFSFLYIPAVVVASFDDPTTLLCTGIACFFGFLLTLFVPSPDGGVEWTGIQAGASYQGTVLSIFLVQLLVTVLLPILKVGDTLGYPASGGPGQTLSRMGWYAFDFGNSLLISVGALYFGPWLVSSQLNAGLLSIAAGVAGVVTLVVAPVVGRRLDRGGLPRNWLIVCSLAMWLGTLALALVSWFPSTSTNMTLYVVILFLIIYAGYQLSLVPYTALLRPLADGHNIDSVSGKGAAIGWIGMLVGALVVLPFSPSGPWGNPSLGEASVFLPAAAIYGLVTLVSLALIGKIPVASASSSGATKPTIARLLKSYQGIPGVAALAIFYLLFSDASVTLETNASAVMSMIGGMSSSSRTQLAAVTLTATAAAAYLGTRGRKNTPRRPRRILAGTIAALLAVSVLALIPQPLVLWLSLPMVGASIGMVRANTRALYSEIASQGELGMVVGAFASIEKAGAVLGPLIWGGVLFMVGQSIRSYQTVLAITGIVLLTAVITVLKSNGFNRLGVGS